MDNNLLTDDTSFSRTTLMTTGGGILGGLAKAGSMKILLLQVNPSGCMTVILYAALSAATGYVMKLGMDYARAKVSTFKLKISGKNDGTQR